MSIHLEAKSGEIASTVLITGDPLRAKHFAEKWLSDSFCYNRIRGMLGYTGTYEGKSISIQGTGIGIPSTALYLHELIHSYGVNCVMRLGTCGAIQPELKLGDLILAKEAYTDSLVVRKFLNDDSSLPTPAIRMRSLVEKFSQHLSIPVKQGAIFSTDLFYSDDARRYDALIKRGVLGVDMETSLLYAMASYYKINAIALLTVSDNIITGSISSAEDREKGNNTMIKLALSIAEEMTFAE